MIKIKSKWIKIFLLVLVIAVAAAAKPFYDGYSEYRKMQCRFWNIILLAAAMNGLPK